MRWVRVILVLALAMAVVGCGSDTGSEESAGAETVTVTETVDEAPAPAEPADEEPAREAPAPEEPTSAGDGSIRVPDVVGEDHQLAQDTMQAAGLYNLAEEDATGEGRMLLYDRNWTVVSQDPPAGTMVNEDQTIVLSSQKDDE